MPIICHPHPHSRVRVEREIVETVALYRFASAVASTPNAILLVVGGRTTNDRIVGIKVRIHVVGVARLRRWRTRRRATLRRRRRRHCRAAHLLQLVDVQRLIGGHAQFADMRFQLVDAEDCGDRRAQIWRVDVEWFSERVGTGTKHTRTRNTYGTYGFCAMNKDKNKTGQSEIEIYFFVLGRCVVRNW